MEEVEKFFSRRTHTQGAARGPKKEKTSEAMMAINEKNAENKLRRLMNTNFGHRDPYITLTYARKNEPPEPEAAVANVKKFKNDVRRLCKKNGAEFKFIESSEWKGVRPHHHMVINIGNMDDRVLDDLWPHGRIKHQYLDDTGQYGELAAYFIKVSRKAFRDPESPCRKRWTASRNLVKPEPKVEIIRADSWKKEPKARQGFIIEKDRCFEGYHDFTGYPYQFYSMRKACNKKE
ncbi:rolling circle replication-associated protein [Eubacterium aggregans]|uniref:rolling circle replication-associated protein n=1 Tax=Eubacterium aggregans TaxID=81409 RepID=UPI00115F8944|nr:hypothetical protein [Eubacterium aggregans]